MQTLRLFIRQYIEASMLLDEIKECEQWLAYYLQYYPDQIHHLECLFLWSITMNQPTITKILLEKGININCVDQYGNTPLHIATVCNNLTLVQMLLTQKSTDTNIKNRWDWTPIQLAAVHGNRMIYDSLLKQDADAFLYNDKNLLTNQPLNADRINKSQHTYHVEQYRLILNQQEFQYRLEASKKALNVSQINRKELLSMLQRLEAITDTKQLQTLLYQILAPRNDEVDEPQWLTILHIFVRELLKRGAIVNSTVLYLATNNLYPVFNVLLNNISDAKSQELVNYPSGYYSYLDRALLRLHTGIIEGSFPHSKAYEWGVETIMQLIQYGAVCAEETLFYLSEALSPCMLQAPQPNKATTDSQSSSEDSYNTSAGYRP